MTIRFFILQAHYRSQLDFGNEALQAAQKGFDKLMKAMLTIGKITPQSSSTVDIASLEKQCYDALNDDFNSPILIANLFEAVRIVNSAYDGKEKLTAEDISQLKSLFNTFVIEILGLEPEMDPNAGGKVVEGLMKLILEIRANARANKDWATSDKIRDELAGINISVKDTKDGATWSIE
jgi:cysteinyl-tRNA synthetase